jgi:hypothetical protein
MNNIGISNVDSTSMMMGVHRLLLVRIIIKITHYTEERVNFQTFMQEGVSKT